MSAAAFLKARDFLFAHREDYDTAYRDFRWPVLDQFNWALDYFDRMAYGNDRPALWIVDEGGGEARLSFAEMAERSSRVANYLRGLGVKRGDRILLMLGNVVPLWEVMLAAMKLGAVTIPASTLLTRDDLIDRFDRGRARHVVTSPEHTAKFADIPGGYTRIATGGAAGLARLRRRREAPARSRRTARPGPATRCCSISPRAPRRSRSSCCTATRATRSAHLSTMYWIGLQPGRHPPQHLLARLGQACLELLFHAVERRRLRLHAEPAALQREKPARRARALQGHDVLRAADRVAHADPGRSARRGRSRCASWSAPASRSTPRSSSRCAPPGAW